MTLADFIESIGVVQMRIEDYINEDELIEIEVEKERLVKKKTIEYLGLEVPKKKLCITHKGRIGWIKPQCPYCGSFWMRENGWRPRKLKTIGDRVISLNVQIYQCGDCSKSSPAPLDELLCAYKQFTKEIISLAVFLHLDCQIPAKVVAGIIKFILNVTVSWDTVARWSKNIDDFIGDFDLYDEVKRLSYVFHWDEQKIKLDGEEKWRFTLINGSSTVLGDEIRDDRRQETLADFIRTRFLPVLDRVEPHVTDDGKEIYAFVTDLDDTYDAILDELRREIAKQRNIPLAKIKIVHQLCIFHLFQHVIREFKKASGWNPYVRKKLPEDLDKLRKELFAVFYHKTKEGARKAFDEIYERRFDYKPKVRRVLENIDRRWDDYTHYLEFPGLPKTNNCVENYFRKTHPERMKKLYKSKKTIEAHLKGMSLKHSTKATAFWLSLIGLYADIFEVAGLLGRFVY